jgi:hypothetical protein
MCGCSVTRYIRALGIPAEDFLHRDAARVDIDLVVREQQRAVDVEENEPTVGHRSRASRSERTYACNAAGPSSDTSTAREPTTIPSARLAAA